MKLNTRQKIFFISIVLAGSLISYTSLDYSVKASSGGYHNAVEGKDVTAWGVWGYITWTNPDLNGGSWSYHRVAIAQWNPWRFVETGWMKTANGFKGSISYDDGSGGKGFDHPLAPGTYRYSAQYDPNVSRYIFFVDGVYVWDVDANFSTGDVVLAGGETATGVEDMNHTYYYDLRYLIKSNNNYYYRLWNGHSTYVEDPPYYTTNSGTNAFYTDP